MIRLLPGDCREVLATLPANSVHCVCTSPPYYALRSYLPDGHADKHREIGSEPTPDAYLAEMVGVFREVRRVLRPDGTCWVNMGSSYASGTTKGRGVSGGKRANQSLSCERVPAYGSDGTAPEDYRDPDYAYSGPDDGLSNGSLNHHDHTADNDQPQQQSWRHSENVAAHGSEQRVAFDKPMPQPDARVSTSLASSGSAQDACGLGGPALAALSGDQTLPGAELQSDGSSAFPSALHSYSDVDIPQCAHRCSPPPPSPAS